MYKPLQILEILSRGVLYLEIALKYKVKQSKNGKIDFETQISLHR